MIDKEDKRALCFYAFIISMVLSVGFFSQSLADSPVMPTEHGSIDDQAGHLDEVYLRLDGANSSQGTGTYALTAVTIQCASAEVTGVCQAHIFNATPVVDSAERVGWGSLQQGFIFMYDAGGGEVAVGHWEDGEIKHWQFFAAGHADAPDVNIAAITEDATGDIVLRGFKRVAG